MLGKISNNKSRANYKGSSQNGTMGVQSISV